MATIKGGNVLLVISPASPPESRIEPFRMMNDPQSGRIDNYG